MRVFHVLRWEEDKTKSVHIMAVTILYEVTKGRLSDN